MFKPTSRLRHKDKRKLLQMCIEKEAEGWECIIPIHHTGRLFNHYRGNDFDGLDQQTFYEAVYRKVIS